VNQTSPGVINLGSCWGTPSGQDLSMPSYMATGNQCVAEAILRRWSTSPGQLIDDPTYGYNLTDLVSDDLSSADISYAQQQAASQAKRDERVRNAKVAITLLANGTLQVVGQITTASGPFRLVVSVSSVTTQLLLVSP
jgi:phage baseplate assembly protein W